MKIPLVLVTLVFFAGLWQGWEAPPAVTQELFEALGQVAGPLLEQGPAVLVLLIFLNNALKSLLALLLGIGFGIVPLLFVAVNGYTVGAVSHVVALDRGLGTTIGALLPHGIIEVPAVLVASACGVAIGREALVRVVRKSGRVRWQLRQGLRIYLRWIAPALAIAALVEVFLTPLIFRSIAS